MQNDFAGKLSETVRGHRNLSKQILQVPLYAPLLYIVHLLYLSRVAGPLISDCLTLETKVVSTISLLVLSLRTHTDVYLITCIIQQAVKTCDVTYKLGSFIRAYV